MRPRDDKKISLQDSRAPLADTWMSVMFSLYPQALDPHQAFTK